MNTSIVVRVALGISFASDRPPLLRDLVSVYRSINVGNQPIPSQNVCREFDDWLKNQSCEFS